VDDDASRVYWMVGMAGTGKSTIAQTFCEMLDGKNMLGASFFCSRTSENTRNARLIIPAIAHALASSSPSIKAEVVKAIDNEPELAEWTYSNLPDQFQKLIRHPIETAVPQGVKTYKVIVIDAVDECTDLRVVSSLIQLFLQSTSAVPLKVFIASRDENYIRNAFYAKAHLEQPDVFHLHEVKKDVVKEDISRYLTVSLAEIHKYNIDTTGTSDTVWPSQSELSRLLDHAGKLFIYAATAIRYIDEGGEHYMSRLSVMANQDSKSGSKLQTSTIDGLYGLILEHASASKEDSEVIPMRRLVSIIIFLRDPLPIEAIVSLSELGAQLYLSPLRSVIHIPTDKKAVVAPFHASFPDFVTDPARCSPERCPSFKVLVAHEGHELLALQCLKLMICSLKYNICGVPEELTVSRRGTTNSNDISKISEALKYACLYWASHLAESQICGADLVTALGVFLNKYLLHWIECLSSMDELETGVRSLVSASAVLSVSDSHE
jgi:nucleoside-triphosphatase THEP1